MGLARASLLKAADSRFLRERAPRYRFVRGAVSRFMPGEAAVDALAAAEALQRNGVAAVLTKLGENIREPAEAEAVTRHYLELFDLIAAQGLPATVSVKPTQLGLDLAPGLCQRNLARIVKRAAEGQEASAPIVWIDMESSAYTDRTLDLYRHVRGTYANVGLCLQAYLRRTPDDLESLLPLGPAIRLVKGAYREPPSVALAKKKEVDAQFLTLAKRLLAPEARRQGVRLAIATHDLKLIGTLCAHVETLGLAHDDLDFQMLYGIQRAEQVRLARTGWRCTVLISFGDHWFPWFMRRLAERPANVGFLLRNLLR